MRPTQASSSRLGAGKAEHGQPASQQRGPASGLAEAVPGRGPDPMKHSSIVTPVSYSRGQAGPAAGAPAGRRPGEVSPARRGADVGRSRSARRGRPAAPALGQGAGRGPGQRGERGAGQDGLGPAAEPVGERDAGAQRHPGLDLGAPPQAGPLDQLPVRGDDGADAGGRGHDHGPVMLDGPDAGHGQLLEALAGLPVELEVRVVGLHGEQVGPGGDLGGDQAVEADLVADHVAEPDLADAEHHGPVAGR